MATLPYWNNDEVISSDKLNSMVQAIINGDPLAVKVSNATKNDVNQIVGYLSSLHDKAKTNLNSATSTSAFDTAYTNMTALVSNKLGAYANDDTVDLYSTGIRASIITFLQAYDTMMSSDRLNNKNTDNTLGGRIDSETHDRETADNEINTKISDMQANGGGRNLLRNSDVELHGKAYSFANVGLTVNHLEPGETYTMSWYGKVDVNATRHKQPLQVYIYSPDWKYVFSSEIQYTANEYTRSVLTFTIPEGVTTVNCVTFYLQHYNSDPSQAQHDKDDDAGMGYVKNYVLEKGIVAHDWQPAPEDTDAEFTALNDRVMQNRGTVNAPDFNSLTQAGYYTITRPDQGNNYPPTGSWGTLEVSGQVVDVNGRLNQKYVSDSGGTIYTRQLNNGTKAWTAWVKIATQNDIDSVRDLANSKANLSDINWTNVVANSSNTYNYASGSTINLPNNSSITVRDDRVIPRINLPIYFTDHLWNTDLNNLATSGEYDSAFIPSATMATLTNRPTNPDTNAPLTGDCFYTSHYAYSGTTVRAFQKIYSCDYNYTFTRSYNGSSASWTNWSCLTPYA